MSKKRDDKKDKAGVGPDPALARRRLVSMDELDGFRIADGEPDIRGWMVCTLSGRDLGSVEDLLVDPETGDVVMLEMALAGSGTRAEVPLRSVQLDRGRDAVLIDSGDIESHDRYETRARDRMTEDERADVRNTYSGTKRDVRYGEREVNEEAMHLTDDVEERVIETRPVVEEVVVRRRVVDEDDS